MTLECLLLTWSQMEVMRVFMCRCVHVYLCGGVHAHVCMRVWVCVHVYGGQRTSSVSPSERPYISLDTGSFKWDLGPTV